MFLSDKGWQIEAGEALESELRLLQAKRAETKRFSGPLTAKLSEVAGAVSAVFGLEPIGKAIKTCGVAEKDLEGYALKEPVSGEETKNAFYDFQSTLDRAAEATLYELIRAEKFKEFARLEAQEEWESSKQTAATLAPALRPVPALEVSAQVIRHTSKVRRNTLTPVIEMAQSQCRNPNDTAEVWAALSVLAQKKHAPLFGATDEGLQYYKGGEAAIFTRKSLGKRLAR